MAELHEFITLAPAMTALLSLVAHCRLAKLSGSGLFAYGLLLALVIAVAATAISLAPADPATQAVTDTGILLAGALAFAASGWLLFAFGIAGDTGDR
ncbi:MAG TPA: hypothetical protein VGJ92_04825 [Methanocella sp.]|jgi:hypothetical protein